MKETKMYISNLPKSCSECPCTHEDFAECNWCQVFDNGLLTFIPDEIYSKERLKNCPLIDIKTHDRELVEKVLEKTKTFVRENTYICGVNATREDIITSSSYNQALRDVLGFMQTLQKEFKYD